MDTLRQIRFQALEPNKIDALIQMIDYDLGYKLYEAIEQAKCHLSAGEASRFMFGEASIVIEKDVSRSGFESWIAPDIQELGNCIDRLLARCNVGPRDVDAIFMTGGSSFVPAIRKYFGASLVMKGNFAPGKSSRPSLKGWQSRLARCSPNQSH
jgi:hypothetical chaperone protein